MARLELAELTRPPEEAVRRLALRILEEAGSSFAVLADPDAPDALHGLRVNFRRLRSTLQAFASSLERRPTARALERLRKLGARSNEARDAEVQCAWLAARRPELSRGQRAAADWLMRELTADRDAAHAQLREKLPDRFEALRADLEKTLRGYRTWVHLSGPDPSPTFASLLAEALRRCSKQLQLRLAAITSPSDFAACHAARIEAKRLRYLLEPAAAHVPAGKRSIRSLKELQDVLGEMHDLEVLAKTLETAIERVALDRAHTLIDAVRADDEDAFASARRRSLENGLLALAKQARDRHRKRFGELEAAWLGERSARFFDALDTAARALDGLRREPLEIERKFLLDSLPDAVRDAPCMQIEQGWLPGDQIRERLRRVTDASGERFYRTIKLGSGLTRTEYEEPLSRERFEILWPQTRGCRIAKRRHCVQEGDRLWQIDVFEGRDLVIAEVELPEANAQLELPEWLARAVVREVTEEPAYSNLRLAN